MNEDSKNFVVTERKFENSIWADWFLYKLGVGEGDVTQIGRTV
jgi:hypothetical protein